MHYRLEVIMPPTDDVKAAIEEIMLPFKEEAGIVEHPTEEDEYLYPYQERYSFYDWYQIGGRWAGQKTLDGLDSDKLKGFYSWLSDEGITVSGITFGKQELKPASQAVKVDDKWSELFGFKPCPIFKHSQKHYETLDGGAPGDIMKLSECIKAATASHVIVAAPSYRDKEYTGPLEPVFMIEKSMYNGVSFIDTKWNGTLKQAVSMFKKKIKNYKDEYIKHHTPKNDWIVVTVDYHT